MTTWKACPVCGAAEGWCHTEDAFHRLLQKHGVSAWCWSSVGPGWISLLDSLLTDLAALGWSKRVGQIKEKYGSLRFYADAVTDEQEARIHQAEVESLRTCATCGQPGELCHRGWMYVACAEHTL